MVRWFGNMAFVVKEGDMLSIFDVRKVKPVAVYKSEELAYQLGRKLQKTIDKELQKY